MEMHKDDDDADDDDDDGNQHTSCIKSINQNESAQNTYKQKHESSSYTIHNTT